MEIIAAAFGSLGQTFAQLIPQIYTLSVEKAVTLSLGKP